MPRMINEETPQLKSAYLTILELGGAYAHIFATLLDFINLPTLVVTDLDSVAIDEEKPSDKRKRPEKCRADKENAVTSNASIKSLLLGKNDKPKEKQIYDEKRKISSLIKLTPNDKTCSSSPYRYVTFQQAVPMPEYGEGKVMIPRTFEEVFIYENIGKIRENKINVFISLDETKSFEIDYAKIYEAVKSDNYKKSEFALNIINTDEQWKTPTYIAEGLDWLCKVLELEPITQTTSAELS
jgi:hypothetical protein